MMDLMIFGHRVKWAAEEAKNTPHCISVMPEQMAQVPRFDQAVHSSQASHKSSEQESPDKTLGIQFQKKFWKFLVSIWQKEA